MSLKEAIEQERQAKRQGAKLICQRLLEGLVKINDRDRDHYLITNFHEVDVCTIQDIDNLRRYMIEFLEESEVYKPDWAGKP